MAVMMQCLWGGDEFEGLASTANGVGGEAPVERRQFSPVVDGQPQQVNVGDLSVSHDRGGFEDLQDTDILGPEAMTWRLAKPAKNG